MAAQRLAQVEALVESRLELLKLLRRVHSAEAGDPVYWADSVLLSQRDLREFYKTPEATTRFRSLVALGVSFGTIMPLPSGELTIHASNQLLSEFDVMYSSGAASVVTDIKTLVSRSHEFPESVWDVVSRDPFASRLPSPARVHVNKRAYQHAVNPKLNGPVDPIEVAISLCDLLGHLYRKFLDPCTQEVTAFNAVVRIDRRVKALVFSPLSQDLTKLALKTIAAAVPTSLPATT